MHRYYYDTLYKSNFGGIIIIIYFLSEILVVLYDVVSYTRMSWRSG